MFSAIWHTIFFDPIYNSLVFFIDVVRGHDVGVAIILTVILVKILILPVSIKAARTQIAMRELEPRIAEIKEKYKNKNEEQSRKMVELFQEARVNPLSSVLLLFIQIPIIFALYFAVNRGGGVPLPGINTTLLYPFITVPSDPNIIFLGIVSIQAKSFILAIVAAVAQYIHTALAMPKLPPRNPNAGPNFKDDLQRSMNTQMRFVMPAMIGLISYGSVALALYFIVSSLMSIVQEYVIRHKGLKLPQTHTV